MTATDRPFTAEMARTMSPAEIRAFWQERQRERRDRGEQHYTAAVDAVTGATLYGIDALDLCNACDAAAATESGGYCATCAA